MVDRMDMLEPMTWVRDRRLNSNGRRTCLISIQHNSSSLLRVSINLQGRRQLAAECCMCGHGQL
jgi:hypothetical protein